MVDLDTNELVQKRTDWVKELVIVKKPNEKLEVWLDQRPLNKAIKREHLHPPLSRKCLPKC